MGWLDDLMQSLSGAEEAIHPEMGRALQGLFQENPDGTPGIGLEGLLQRLQAAGFGGIVQSWLGGGTNMPISPNQLREAIGEGDVTAMASAGGVSPTAWLESLSEHLPSLVNRLSPNGKLLPAGAGGTSVDL